MFLLPPLLLALALAAALGGNLARLLRVEFRCAWLLVVALGDQVILFTGPGATMPRPLQQALHLASYALLFAFAALNLRLRSLWPLFLGMALNAAAISANGGHMPLSADAARSAGITVGSHANVADSAGRLRFLGDMFALPPWLPLANVYSVGDVLIAAGTLTFVLAVSLGGGERGAGRPLHAA